MALYLTGCATQSPRPAVVGGEAQCQSEIDAIPGIASLRPHLQTDLKGSRTPAMLQDRARPDKAQRAAITRFDQVKVVCQRRTVAQLVQRGTSPALLDILDGAATVGHAARLQLARGEMTFGEFNQRAEAIDANTRAAVERLQHQPASPAGTTSVGTSATAR
jgi:hypothetical protein